MPVKRREIQIQIQITFWLFIRLSYLILEIRPEIVLGIYEKSSKFF